MPVNPYQKYQQQSVMTMTPGEMLLKLYDEVITQLTAVKQFNEEKDYQGANAALKKSQRIISYLDQTLDPQYEISGSLSALYDYFIRRLVDANMHKENGPIDEVLPMIEELTAGPEGGADASGGFPGLLWASLFQVGTLWF